MSEAELHRAVARPAGLAARFARLYEVDPTSGCWVWKGYTGGRYGRLRLGGKSEPYIGAHRVAWELHRGPIPEGLVIDHLCRNKACVNPDHLEPVPQSINRRRGIIPNRDKTHCIRGHEFSGANLNITSDGNRRCVACANALEKRRKRIWAKAK